MSVATAPDALDAALGGAVRIDRPGVASRDAHRRGLNCGVQVS